MGLVPILMGEINMETPIAPSKMAPCMYLHKVSMYCTYYINYSCIKEGGGRMVSAKTNVWYVKKDIESITEDSGISLN